MGLSVDDEMMGREVGDCVEGLKTAKHPNNCQAHPVVVTSTVKSLRLAEANHKMLKLILGILIALAASQWAGVTSDKTNVVTVLIQKLLAG